MFVYGGRVVGSAALGAKRTAALAASARAALGAKRMAVRQARGASGGAAPAIRKNI